jgi:hypothetical protein
LVDAVRPKAIRKSLRGKIKVARCNTFIPKTQISGHLKGLGMKYFGIFRYHLVHFLNLFGICYGPSFFVIVCCSFPILIYYTKENLTTLEKSGLKN